MSTHRGATLVIDCLGTPGIGGAPLRASLDGTPIFLAWDRPQEFRLPAGRHGLEIAHEPVRWPFGANKLSNSIELRNGFRYYLRYIPRLVPTFKPKVQMIVDRPAG